VILSFSQTERLKWELLVYVQENVENADDFMIIANPQSLIYFNILLKKQYWLINIEVNISNLTYKN
jgi:hypothetical protein